MISIYLVVHCVSQPGPDDLLSSADQALSSGQYHEAIEFYKAGLNKLDGEVSILTELALNTNLATAFTSIDQTEDAVSHYQWAISKYMEEVDDIDDAATKQYATDIASQASFFLGMTFQDLGESEKAVEAYGYSVMLDPNHWSALGNMGSVLHDVMKSHEEALAAYNKAYEILTTEGIEATDPPAEPRFILSQLQYRIGLCLHHDLSRKCIVADKPDEPVSCKEMATHAFSLAVQFDPDNEAAKHMLATITADATMKRASNEYVKNLFDDYAQK